MRFKANLINPTGLYKIAQTLERLGQTCILSLSNENVRLIKYRDLESGMQAWTKLQPSTLFSNYRIESTNRNEIHLSLLVDDLLRVSRTAQQCTDIRVQLRRKRDLPVLDWSMVSENRGGSTTMIGQEIQVSLIPPDRWQSIREPLAMDYPDAYVRLPDLNGLRQSASRLKSLGKYLIVSANMQGTFKLMIETEFVQCESVYHHLENPRLENYTPAGDLGDFRSVKITSEDFSSFLNSHHLEPLRSVCAIHDESQVTFYVYMDLESYQYQTAAPHLAGTRESIMTFHIPVYNE
ncbi:checkpoint protein Hus1/Mec3 [Dichotomocladium elegans]|nr:checkpoint protein Hus1/Mec3 [Dichotomocladium elegans]